jgi:Flp pilus assembly protein TadB
VSGDQSTLNPLDGWINRSRSRRIGTQVFFIVFFVVYAAAFVFAHDNLAHNNEVKAWFAFIASLIGAPLLTRRVIREVRDPEAAEREARAKEQDGPPWNGAGFRLFAGGWLLAITGFALLIANLDLGVYLVVPGMLFAIAFSSPSDWRKRWPQDFPVLRRVFGR